jgi:outer membrane lipoprotein-sorting protein
MQKIPSILPGGDERKAYEVRGTDNYGNFVKLYFDSESGLLLRTIYFKKNPFGSVAMETNYSDYRDVDGVKLPFVINWRGPGSNETVTINDIKNNVTVDDSKFEMPPKE